MKICYVYILASGHHGTLYVDVTGNLVKRIYEHKTKAIKWFTEKYRIDRLVYYESIENPEEAIVREKNIKAWKRDWKIRLIEEKNSQWRDLYEDIVG